MDLSTSYTIKAQVQGQNQIGGLQKSLGGLKTSTNNTATAMNKLKSAASNAFGVLKNLAPAIGIAGMGKLVNDTLDLGDQLEKMSQKTGLAVPVLDKLRQAADLGGTDFKTLSKAFPTLAKNMQDASDGVGTAKEAFDRLGVSVTNNDGSLKSLDTMFFEISDKIKEMDDRTLAAANASEIFGTGMGSKLIPVMNQGSEAIQSLSTGFTQLGAERMATFNDKFAQMGEKFNVLKVQLTSAVLPALEKLVDIVTVGVEKFTALPGPVKGIVLAIGLLLPLIVTLVPLFAAMVISIKAIAAVKLGAVFAAITPAIGGVVSAVGGLVTAFAPFLAAAAIPLAIAGLGVLIFKFRDEIGQAFKAVGDFLVALKDSFVDIMQMIAETIKEPFNNFVDFVKNVFNTAFESIKSVFTNIVDSIKNAFTNAIESIRSGFNALPSFVSSVISKATAPIRSFMSFISSAISRIREFLRMRAAASRESSSSGEGSGENMALGGVVTSPTLGYLGEAGSEYVIPARKAAQFSKNYLAGYRGSSAVPRFAEGGYVAPNVNITTGAVTQMDGTNFVTTKDLTNAVQSGISQTITILQSDLRTRRSLGLT